METGRYAFITPSGTGETTHGYAVTKESVKDMTAISNTGIVRVERSHEDLMGALDILAQKQEEQLRAAGLFAA